MNLKAVDNTLGHLFEVPLTAKVNGAGPYLPPVTDNAPDYVKKVLGRIAAGEGDDLPVSAFPPDGTFPTATAQYEKRNLAIDIPVWDPAVCIQCLKCVAICPHATIRAKVYDAEGPGRRPGHLQVDRCPGSGMEGHEVVPAGRGRGLHRLHHLRRGLPRPQQDRGQAQGHQHAAPGPAARRQERANWDFFLRLPEMDRRKLKTGTLRQQQIMRPLFEFSGACAGCGETPYIKMVTQLFGDRMIVANATGCSSIYGGNLPTTPYAKNADGRGPAWCNSLFEDNAEFGLGFRVSHRQTERVRRRIAPEARRRPSARTWSMAS